MSNIKRNIILAIIAIGTILILIFQGGIYGKPEALEVPADSNQTISLDNTEARVISTKPNPLDRAIILPNQIIEITFNYPLENVGEFKYKIDPKPEEYKVELSQDKKTVQIIPIKPFTLGTSYSLDIEPGEHGTKFEGGKRLKDGVGFGFNTIAFKGS